MKIYHKYKYFNYNIGLEISRQEELPNNINLLETRNKIKNNWSKQNILDNKHNLYQSLFDKPIQNINNIILAGNIIDEYYDNDNLKVLEIMAGNCYASSIIKEKINKKCKSWISTDVITYENRNESIPFSEDNSISAVDKFGNDANILLLISPLPCNSSIDDKNIGYGDYYACYDFIEQTKINESKFIIFIGELGASDGSTGMYDYMINNHKLKLVKREMLEKKNDIMTSGFIEKEIFIFLITK